MLTMPFMAQSQVAYNGPPIYLNVGYNFRSHFYHFIGYGDIKSVNFSDEYTTTGQTGYDRNNILRCSVTNNVVTLANAQGRVIFANVNSAGMFEGLYSATSIDVTRITWDLAVNVMNIFQNCRKLVTFPTDLPAAESLANAFYYCYSMTRAPNIPNAKYMNNAFYYCSNITSIPPTSGKMFVSCFEGCANLRSVHFPAGAQILNRALKGCELLEEPVYIPSSAYDVYCMFENIAHEQDVYVGNANLNLYGLLYAKNNNYRVNIHVPNNTCTAYTTANKSVTNGVTWASGDGFVYNAARNIYLYADYVPA